VTGRQSFTLASKGRDLSRDEMIDVVKAISASVPGILQTSFESETGVAVLEIPSHAVATVRELLGERFHLDPNGPLGFA
jgi:hypothetical protein